MASGLLELIAIAIGREISGSEVLPVGNWLRAAEASLGVLRGDETGHIREAIEKVAREMGRYPEEVFYYHEAIIEELLNGGS